MILNPEMVIIQLKIIQSRPYLVESMKTKSDYDIAMVFMQFIKINMFASTSQIIFGMNLKNNQWREIDSGTTLRSHLSDEHHLYVCEIRNCVQKMTDIE